MVPKSSQDFEIVRCRHGEGGKSIESQSTTPVGGMEQYVEARLSSGLSVGQ